MARTVTTHTIADGVSYSSHPHHREASRRRQKSQWTISESDEIGVFRAAFESGWLDTESGWGLHIPDNAIAQLGTAIDGETALHVAKFIATGATPWHGYPADHQRRIEDVPSERHLNAWMQRGLLTNAKVRKLVKQQPCNL